MSVLRLLMFTLGLLGGLTPENPCWGQTSDSIYQKTLPEVSVTFFKDEPIRETSLNVQAIHLDSSRFNAGFSLSEVMSKVPGVSMLSTGPGISKPVIRGLSGNRVLVLISGLKFDNQQWQEEHGLGITDLGIERIELIKGPMSVMYGSEAIGGVINLIEENQPAPNTFKADAGIRFNTNTLGGSIQAGYKMAKKNLWFRIRVGADNHADYSDGKQQRILNSRFDGYALKSSVGFRHKNWTSYNHLFSSFNRFGFIFNDIYTFVRPDARWSRTLGKNPSHQVILNVLHSENKFTLPKQSKLSLNVGVQSNERMEREGGGKISLNMHLLTVQYLLKYEKLFGKGHRLILSHLNSFEDNTNFGARKIVPDAHMQEANIGLFYEAELHEHFNFENGINVGEKVIKTYFTPGVNNPEKEVHPFTKIAPYFNVYTGFNYMLSQIFNLKLNASTGVRIPNLAELSSNGLHEGIFTYEIGDPAMKNEQNVGVNLLLDYRHPFFNLYVSPFYNYFFNYVYLAPVAEEWFGFPVYRFKQQNARQFGGEFQIGITPYKTLNFSFAYSYLNSKTTDGRYTPYLPAQKMVPGFQYTFHWKHRSTLLVSSEVEHFLAENRVYPGEVATPAYTLWNIQLQYQYQTEKHHYTLGILANNLLNAAYYDHLSRFKNYGLLNMGRNISIQFKYDFLGKYTNRL